MAAVVIDASALVEVLAGSAPDPELRKRVLGSELAAPDLINVEVLSVLRRLDRTGRIGPDQANRAAWWLAQAPIATFGHRTLATRVWELRPKFQSFGATYIALAEELDVPLVTCDTRLTDTGHHAEIELFPSS